MDKTTGQKTTLSKAISKELKRIRINDSDLDILQTNIEKLRENIDQQKSEEYNKKYVRDFLNLFYPENKGFSINTDDNNIDLTISKANDKNKPLVLIECKSPKEKVQFPTLDNINVKSLQQLLYYYLRERLDEENLDIKHLCITNGLEWYFFEAKNFDKVLANKEIKRRYNEFRKEKKVITKASEFYSHIAQPHIHKVGAKLKYTYIDLEQGGGNIEDIYRFFSPQHFIKAEVLNHGNHINKEFYDELLYIMGMEEITGIEKKTQIKPIEEAQEGFLEYNIRLRLANLKLPEEKKKEIALRLCIVWINRVLFLKLLEAQLLKYHSDEKARYGFLSTDKIKSYNGLNQLFFEVLAVQQKNRQSTFARSLAHIPYLNSSLFEENEDEKEYLSISKLENDKKITYHKRTILKGPDGKQKHHTGKQAPLAYLFEFLEAYDFGSGISQDKGSTKPLINAAVLGLIFEKINGYQDGAYFTPGTVTQYMCQEALEKTVLQKFSTSEKNYQNLDELRQDIGNKVISQKDTEAKIDSLKICDPSVGSGHFLVSALNQLLYIKYTLGIFSDTEEKYFSSLDFVLTVENDELQVKDNSGKPFVYQPNHPQNQRIQKAIFHQKQKLIENCLFGVDLNPNSVNICRLRLWIELLKHAYYKNAYTKDETNEIETLPNIDINIKQGDALLNFFHVSTDPTNSKLLREYQESVSLYKNNVAENKIELRTEIQKLKENIQKLLKEVAETQRRNTATFIKSKIQKIKDTGFDSETLVRGTLSGTQATKIKTLEKQLAEKETAFKDFVKNQSQAFEWRYEFPEVLGSDYAFIGFDLIIGNPPYIQMQAEGGKLSKRYTLQQFNTSHKNNFTTAFGTLQRTGDIYSLFFEKAAEICRPNGFISLITSNKWLRAGYGKSLRSYFTKQLTPLQLFDLGANVFDSATVDTSILLLQNKPVPQANHDFPAATLHLKRKEIHTTNLKEAFDQKQIDLPLPIAEDSWAILSPIEQEIKTQIEKVGTPLKEWDIQINYGIKTGYNEAFIIDEAKRQEILSACDNSPLDSPLERGTPKAGGVDSVLKEKNEYERTNALIKPILRGRDIKKYQANWAGLYLIATHNGYKDANEKDVQRIDIENYPALKQHLDKHWGKIKKRQDKGDTPYNLRNCTYHPEFQKEKIVWADIATKPNFQFFKDEIYFNNTAYMISGGSSKYLVGILNSKIVDFYFPLIGTGLGEKGIRYFKQFVENLPIPKISEEDQKPFEALVDTILSKKAKGENTDKEEQEIDDRVFALYGLSEPQQRVILSDTENN